MNRIPFEISAKYQTVKEVTSNIEMLMFTPTKQLIN